MQQRDDLKRWLYWNYFDKLCAGYFVLFVVYWVTFLASLASPFPGWIHWVIAPIMIILFGFIWWVQRRV